MIRCLLFASLLVLTSRIAVGEEPVADRPNILWISCEDISSHLGCYGDPYATTPNLDALAAEGTRYDLAFTCHGVCAPSRTGIITGMYPITLGANHMRSKVNRPDHTWCFPRYLREAGYYCTNNSKTDYNFRWDQDVVWDESSKKAHWKNRKDTDQPFFAVFNLTMCHESRIWPKNWANVVKSVPESMRHNPAEMEVPPLYPDTSEVRAAFARLLDVITAMDLEVGRRLRELEEAGLAENTIVIFWSDHGNGFPRAKRWIYDSGTRVPMISRVPARYRQPGQGIPGSIDRRLINLIDLGPTTLHLAGLPVPDHMHGRPFLGPGLNADREYIYGARDRVDERFDFVRSVRDRRFRYVRNLMPWRPALQHIKYAETSVVRQEMRRLYALDELDEGPAAFLDQSRAAEELYDLHNDPWELNNLAEDATYADELHRLREECDRWQLSVRDAHLIPEAILAAEEGGTGNRYDILHSPLGTARTSRLLAVAKAAASPEGITTAQWLTKLKDDDPAVRWWATVGVANAGAKKSELTEQLRLLLKDEQQPAVQIAAADALLRLNVPDGVVPVLTGLLRSDDGFVRHAAVMAIDEHTGLTAAAREAVQALPKNEYVGNIAQHALKIWGEE